MKVMILSFQQDHQKNGRHGETIRRTACGSAAGARLKRSAEVPEAK
jgi:hypothetical protein